MRRCIAAALLVLVAACGGDDEHEGVTYEDAPALAAALGCSDSYEESDPDDSIDIGVDLGDISGGSCDLDGAEVSLEVYEDADRASQAERVAKTIGCAISTQFGIDEFVYAAGGNWTVSPEDSGADDVAASAAATLDGRTEKVECG